jgi:hypothetical protein
VLKQVKEAYGVVQRALYLAFPLNYVFISSRQQISQAAKMFCDAWGINSTCLGKKIVCYYGKGPT